MNLKIDKNDLIVKVCASFEKRSGTEKKKRFYYEDALEAAQKEFPNLELIPLNECQAITISNENQPYSGTWIFIISADNTLYTEMANKFEEKKLKEPQEDGKIIKKKRKKEKDFNDT